MSIKELVQQELQAIQAIPMDGSIEDAVQIIQTQTAEKHGKVVVSGVGKAGHIAEQFSTTLCSTGTAATFLSPLEAQHGDLGIIQKEDILFLVSNSGQTREILELVALARNLRPDVKIISMTKHKDSELARAATVAITTGETSEICPFGLTPTTSTTVMKVITDLIVVTLMKQIGFKKEDYAKRHHGGYLGKQAKG